MTSPILVTGGTGTLGRLVVARLREGGQHVRVLSRSRREGDNDLQFVKGDLTAGEGIEAAVDGAEVIIHCAGSSSGDEVKTQHLVEAASRAGARHLVYVSVVGADSVPAASGIDKVMFGYFASKLASEQVVVNSGLPWTTLRATQFHELMLMVVRQMAKLPVIPVPAGFRFQPVAALEAAERLVDLALGAPAGLVPDIAGPRAYEMSDLVRSYLRIRRLRRLMVPLPLPGNGARAVRAGAILAHQGLVGRQTWEDFLLHNVRSN